jgi:predicted PurR-regulated permease PerM
MAQLQPQGGYPGTQQTGLSGPSKFLVTAAAFVIVVAGMKAAVDIIVPFLLSVFLAVISTPALFWLKSRGISTGIAIVVVSMMILLVGLSVGTLLTASIADFTQDLPTYANKLNAEAAALEEKWHQWLKKIEASLHMDDGEQAETEESDESQPAPPLQQKASSPPGRRQEQPFSLTGMLNPQAGVRLMADTLTQFGRLITSGFLIYLTTIFILFEASILPGKIRAAMISNPEAFDNLSSVAGDVKKYLAMKTAISLVTGILIATWLMILGVKYPILWGLIAFLLNFVPSIGSIIAAIPACSLAFIQLGIGPAALAAMGYLVVNIGIGNLIEPRLMGHRLGLSTLVVFLSLVFWGWVLGPMGMLLSVPLTMTVKIVLQSHPDTRKLAMLLGSQNPPTAAKRKNGKKFRR